MLTPHSEQRQRFITRLEQYMSTIEPETEAQANNEMTLEGFLASEYKMSVVHVWLSLLDFGSQPFDQELLESTAARALFSATNKMITIADNLFTSKIDILARRNEQHGNLLIAIIVATRFGLQQRPQKAVEVAITKIFEEGLRFEKHASRLIREFGKTEQVTTMIEGCRFMIGGHIRWCNECPVYGAGRLYGDAMDWDSGMQLGERAKIEDYDEDEHRNAKPWLDEYDGDFYEHYRENKPRKRKRILSEGHEGLKRRSKARRLKRYVRKELFKRGIV